MAILNIFADSREDRFYVRLDILNSPVSISLGAKIVSMSLIESLSAHLPYLVLTFIDYDAILFSKIVIPPDAIFLLSYGEDAKTARQSKFLLNSVKYSQVSSEGLAEMSVEMTLAGTEWIPLFATTKSRSWSNISYSDVVKKLADEIGVKSTHIEPSKEKLNIIQPDWTASQMIKFASSNAVNMDGVGNYAFTINRNSELLFRTFNDMFSQQPKLVINSIDTIQAKTYKDVDSLTQAFQNIENEQKYTLNLQGGFGVEYTYFDFFKKQFVVEKTDIRQSSERQLTDWTYIAQQHIGSGKRFIGGRDTNTHNVALSRSSFIVDSAQVQSFVIVANYDINIGDVIDVKIPDSFGTQKRQLNIVHGGRWLVWKLVNIMSPKEGNFSTMVYLMRCGVGGNKDVTGLVRTKTGKR